MTMSFEIAICLVVWDFSGISN